MLLFRISITATLVLVSSVIPIGTAWGSDVGEEVLVSAEAEAREASPMLPEHKPGARDLESARGKAEEVAVLEEERSWFGFKPWWEWENATGDWGGARTKLSEAGIEIGGSYTLEWSSVWSGGVRNVASTRSLLDVNATLDFGKIVGLDGGTLFVDVYSTDGRGQGDVGDVQGYSNIATDANRTQIAELWYEQKFLDDRVRVKFGKIDANSEFGFVVRGGDLLHSGAAISATTFDWLPTYPDPAMGVVVFAYPSEWLDVGFGLFDGASGDGFRTGGRGPATFFSDRHSSDWYMMGEVGMNWKNVFGSGDEGRHKGRVAAGVWHHTGDLLRFDGGIEGDGTTGFYVLAEQRILSCGKTPAEGEEDEGGLWVFVQYGYADEDVNSVGNQFGFGIVLMGTFPGRDDDGAGVYVSFADLSDDDGAGFVEDETAVEVYYKFAATPFFTIRPDLQIIANPGGDSSLDTAVIGGVRFEVGF